ncbi:50S ribosomal protein L11 [Diplonema papillatum]|nr:50S ribosomal protein L11 [Diplonema papillatum]
MGKAAAMLRGARRCASTDATGRVVPERMHYLFGKLRHTPGSNAEWLGPSMGEHNEPAVNYHGNCDTPKWMLGENGDEIWERCKTLFKGYEPTPKAGVANYRMRLVPGRATAGPPVGPTFSTQGVKSIDFVKAFNEATAGLFAPDPELKLKVYVRFYEDKTYQWRCLPPTTSWLIRKTAQLNAVGPQGFGASPGVGNTQRWEGFITLEQLYHVSSLVNTWDQYPDFMPLEARVVGLVRQAYNQGICVLGVHSRPGPVLGMTDEQYKEHIREQRIAWDKQREQESDADPLLRTPWITRLGKLNTSGFSLPKDREPDAQTIVKDAMAVDKAFQGLLKKETDDDNPKARRARVFWDEFRKTGIIGKQKDQPTEIERRQIENAKEARVQYLLRRYPSVVARFPNYRAMWYSDEWEKLIGHQDMHSRIR